MDNTNKSNKRQPSSKVADFSACGHPLHDPCKEQFARELAAGKSFAEAYAATKPTTKANPKTQREYGSRLAKDPAIVQRVTEIKNEMNKAITARALITQEELLTMLVQTAEQCAADVNASGLAAMSKEIREMMGWKSDTNVNVRNGGVTADYNPPPRFAAMSDEDLAKILKEVE